MFSFIGSRNGNKKVAAILLYNLEKSYTMQWNGERWVGEINGKPTKIAGKKQVVERKLKRRAAKGMVAWLRQEGYLEELPQS